MFRRIKDALNLPFDSVKFSVDKYEQLLNRGDEIAKSKIVDESHLSNDFLYERIPVLRKNGRRKVYFVNSISNKKRIFGELRIIISVNQLSEEESTDEKLLEYIRQNKARVAESDAALEENRRGRSF